ncbi:hypothetical protein [Pseudomonas sp. NFX183]|uniref:hypothetical protein n=1 Tax=Pseudomonas sp. NFX183 TaxID=3399573 RepID=UPI003A5BBA04
MRAILPLTFVLLGFSSAAVYASVTDFPDAQASGPARLKWMVGAPPPPDRTVRFDDGSYFRFPAMRWRTGAGWAVNRTPISPWTPSAHRLPVAA